MIFLIEIDYYNRTSGTNETLCLTTGKHFSKDGKMFVPALSVGLDFSEALFSQGATGGSATSSIGNMKIPNADGKFDYLDYASFDGRQFRSFWAESEESLEVHTYVTGIIKHSQMSMTELELAVSDITDSMDIQMQLGVFAGTNLGMGAAGGLEGGEDDIKGQIKPCIYGRCRNIEPFLINAFHLIYACNYDRDGNRKAVHSFWNVYGKGVEYLYEGDVATTELLISASVSAGYYKSCVAEGTFRLGTVPNGIVTCDVFEAARTEASASKVLQRIFADYPSPSISQVSLDKLNTEISCPIGIYVTTERTLLEVVREIIESVDAWMLPNYEGVTSFGRLVPVLESPKYKLTKNQIRGLERVPTSDNSHNIPSYSVRLLHTKNWKTADRSSLALAVPEERQLFFETEYRVTEYVDLSVLAINPTSKPVEYETLLQGPMPAKVRNPDFKEVPVGVAPFDWLNEDLGTGGFAVVDTAQGTMTVTPGTGATYGKQILSTPDEIYPGEYTISFEVLSGSGELILRDDGVELTTQALSVGLFSYTFVCAGELSIHIGCDTGSVAVSAVRVKESGSLGIPDTEAFRRFELRGVPEERYTFKVSHEFAKDIQLGDEITLEFDRFDLYDGKSFLVIGRSLEIPSIDVELDVWRIRNAT